MWLSLQTCYLSNFHYFLLLLFLPFVCNCRHCRFYLGYFVVQCIYCKFLTCFCFWTVQFFIIISCFFSFLVFVIPIYAFVIIIIILIFIFMFIFISFLFFVILFVIAYRERSNVIICCVSLMPTFTFLLLLLQLYISNLLSIFFHFLYVMVLLCHFTLIM